MVRLDDLVYSLRSVPFAWGINDCCTVSADVVNACTGVDPMNELRGAYGTEFGAARVLAERGGIEALLDERLGPRVGPAFAQHGDIGLCADGRLVFCGGANWFGPGDKGLVVTTGPETVWRCHE